MKKDPIVEAISEFILDSPERPYEEVEAFMQQIGASASQFKEAIQDVSDFLYYEKYFNSVHKEYENLGEQVKKDRIEIAQELKTAERKVLRFPFEFKKLYLKKILIISLLPFFIFLAAGGIYNYLFYKGESATLVVKPELVTTAASKNLIAPIVFANQAEVDAKQVFSYPPSDITLKFTAKLQKEVLGFFPYWMLDVADKISLSPYTSISLFGLTVDANGKILTSSNGQADPGWAMWQDTRLDTFIKRAKKAKKEVFLTIKSFNNSDIKRLTSNNESQRIFISNAIQLMSSKSLSGINIDFEYVGTPEKEVKFAFARLVGNLQSELKRQYPDAILSVDTYLKSASISDFFDVELISQYADFIVVMGYDVHTPSGTPGPIAPMEGENGVLGFMQSYLERVDNKKLILAVPYYGYDWSQDKSKGESKILSFAELAVTSRLNKISWNDTYQSPYYKYIDPVGNIMREVHFENARSLGIKYDYINKKELAGVGIWAMGYDGNNRELEAVLLDKFSK